MRRMFLQGFTLIFLSLAAFVLNTPSGAAESAKTESPGKAKPQTIIPFRGKISAVDKTSKTLTLEGKEKSRIIQITSNTKLVKAGKPAVFDDATVGEEVGGRGHQKAGKIEAVSLRIGPKPEGKSNVKPEAKPKKSKAKEDKREK